MTTITINADQDTRINVLKTLPNVGTVRGAQVECVYPPFGSRLRQDDFKTLAATLTDLRPSYDGNYGNDVTADYQRWSQAVQTVADVCQKSNPAFDRHRFIDGIATGRARRS